jgi:hypothetical protein
MAYHQYNKTQYNASQYNSDANTWIQRLTESIASSDATIGGPSKVLADTIGIASAEVVMTSRAFTDGVLFVDTVTKSISNKGLMEYVRVNDWLQIKRNTDSPNWSN